MVTGNALGSTNYLAPSEVHTVPHTVQVHHEETNLERSAISAAHGTVNTYQFSLPWLLRHF